MISLKSVTFNQKIASKGKITFAKILTLLKQKSVKIELDPKPENVKPLKKV